MTPDPQHEITDAEFERMVEEAGGAAAIQTKYHHGLSRKRFNAICEMRVQLKDMTVDELVAHLEWVQVTARPFPRTRG